MNPQSQKLIIDEWRSPPNHDYIQSLRETIDCGSYVVIPSYKAVSSRASILHWSIMSTVQESNSQREITITSISMNNGVLRSKKPLIFIPEVTEDNLYQIEIKELDYPILGESMDDLEGALSDLLVFMWERYVAENNRKVAKFGLKIKEYMKTNFDLQEL